MVKYLLPLVFRYVLEYQLIFVLFLCFQDFEYHNSSTIGITLPEITIKDFKQAWTCFELIAYAKDWNENKQKLPMLFCGKLVDIYLSQFQYSNEVIVSAVGAAN